MLSKLATIREKITPNTYKIAINTAWLIGDKILRLGAGLFVGVWLARYLRPEQFGLLNYAAAFVTLFAPFASLGLDNIVIREIVNHPCKKNELLGSAFVLKLISAFLSLGVSISSIYLFRTDDLSRLLVVILSIGFIFQSLDVVDFWFQAQVKSKSVVLVRNTAFIITTILRIVLIQTQSSLLAFAMLATGEIMLSAVGLVLAYQAGQKSFLKWKLSFSCAKQLLKDSYPLVFSGFAIVIYMKIDQIMLGQMLGDEAVGIYSAAVRISELWYFIPTAIASSITPTIIGLKQSNPERYYQNLQTAFNGMAMLAYLISISVSFLSPLIISVLYGKAYIDSAFVLVAHVWASVFVFLGMIRGIWLVAENQPMLYCQTTFLGAIVNVVLNLLLIPKYSGLGAAIATVIAYAVSVLFSCILYPQLWDVGRWMIRALTLRWLAEKRQFSP